MSVKGYGSQCYAWHRDRVPCHTQQNQYETWHQKQPTRTAHKKKSYRSPAIAESSKMRSAIFSPIGMKRNWDLGNFCSVETGLDDHFCGEFHARTTLIE